MQDRVAEMRKSIADLSRRVSVARGEHNALMSRKAHLETTVGEAKGRLDRKKDVEAFIEELQSDAHAKRVGDFERLLTALVGEVLPGEKAIGLELEIERGQPSLDIVSRVAADLTEDIFEDQGGALTNIVVLGLRMIAVVRSGMRRFVALDEPDCWMKNERVPAFYSVVKEAARKLGMQCLAVSHHDTSKFAEGISIARIHGHPENADGVLVENDPRPHRWSDEEDGFRHIRLVNFQGYVDQTLHLSPGVSALIGDNNIGKSSFVRALRAVFYGESRDKLIRRGQTSCTVEIGLREGFVLQWTRNAKRNPTWRLLTPAREVVDEEFNTSSKPVPAWVTKQIGIGPIAGLDPHIIKQKLPIFLLDKPGTTRASVLAIGQEASHVREMVRTYKKMCEQDAATIKDGESEMGRLLARQAVLEGVLAKEEVVARLGEIVARVEARNDDVAKAQAVVDALARTEAAVAKTRAAVSVLRRLPGQEALRDLEGRLRGGMALAALVGRIERAESEAERNRRAIAVLRKLPDRLPTLVASDRLIQIGKAVKDAETTNARLRRVIAVLRRLPREAPELRDTKAAVSAVETMDRLMAKAEELKVRRDAAAAAERQAREAISSLVERMGHSCPLCGGHVDDADVFMAHAHGERRVA